MPSRSEEIRPIGLDSDSLPPPLEMAVDQAVASLKLGGVIAYPTDTLYGLGAHGLNEVAVRKAFAIKGRLFDSPIPLLLAEVSDLLRVAVDVPPLTWILARRFWPGPLTLVLPKGPAIPDSLPAGASSVAVRLLCRVLST